MYKHFIIIILWQAISLAVYGQQNHQKTIAKFKKVIPVLKDSAKIDCLNDLSQVYMLAYQRDSAEHYADLALNEARRLNYFHGIGESLISKSKISRNFDDDFIKSEALAKEALSWYEKSPNQKGIDIVYDQLWYTLHAQSRFDEAINYIRKKQTYYRNTGNRQGMQEVLFNFSTIYATAGNYEQSFYYNRLAYQQALDLSDTVMLSHSLYILAYLYKQIENYEAAVLYLRQAFMIENEASKNYRIVNGLDIWVKTMYAEAFCHLKQFDSAWHYYKLLKPRQDDRYYRVYLVSTGECYLLQKNYNQALANFIKGLAYNKTLNDRNEIMRTVLDIAKAYSGLHNYALAISYGRDGLNMAQQSNSKKYIRDGSKVLYTVYDKINKQDSAYRYYKQYIAMKETVSSDQVKGMLAAYNFEQKIELLNKEKAFQSVKLERESLLKNMLIAGVVILLIFGGIFFSIASLRRKNEEQRLKHALQVQRLEAEKINSELQQQKTELEMQAFRAQMNPHFIFNCLNSINHFILKNDPSTASDYLTKFSRLIRMVLYASQKNFITLQEDLDYMELYMQLEQLRFSNCFSYSINIDEEISEEEVKVPPLLFQPFVENAIWHGIMHKEESGEVTIDIKLQDGELCYIITDNGIGREKAGALKSKSAAHQKSLGIQLTAHRLQMLCGNKNTANLLNIIDLTDKYGVSNGTQVIIKIPIKISENVTI